MNVLEDFSVNSNKPMLTQPQLLDVMQGHTVQNTSIERDKRND